jgi:hypothetical protein
MHEGQLTIRDLGSRNGTFVNGSRVGEAVLNRRDTVDIGPVKFQLQDTAGRASPPEPAAMEKKVAGTQAQPAPAPALAAAEVVYRAAVGRGDSASGNSLGLVLQQQGDRAGAEAAYRQAMEAGHAAAAFNLSNLLLQRGDHEGSHQALRIATQLGTRAPYGRPASMTPKPSGPVSDLAVPAPAAVAATVPPFIPTAAVAVSPEQIATVHHREHRSRLWVTSAAVLIAGVGALALAAFVLRPASPCTHNCYVAPPTSPPLTYLTTYHSSQYGFSLAYDGNCCQPYRATAGYIAWNLRGSRGYFQPVFVGVQANGHSADQLVSEELAAHFPGFSFQYQIPNAELGYVAGAGAVYSGQFGPIQGQYQSARVAIVAAVRNGVGIVMACEGSQVSYMGANHPDPSSLAGDGWCDQVLNTITWSGEKPL